MCLQGTGTLPGWGRVQGNRDSVSGSADPHCRINRKKGDLPLEAQLSVQEQQKHLKSSWICVKGASNISNVWQETRELHPHMEPPCLQDTNRLCTLPAGVHWWAWRVQEGGCAHVLPCDSITFPCKDTGLGRRSKATVSSGFSWRPPGQEDTQTRARFTFGEQLKCMPGTGRVVTYMVIQRYRYSVPTMQKNLLLMMDLETQGNRGHSVMELTLQAQRGSQGPNTPSQPPQGLENLK